MACGSGSGIVPRAGGNRGGVYDRRRHAIAAGATEGAIALCALCLIVTQRSSPSRPCAAGAGAAMRKRTPGGLPRLLFYCADITGTAGTGRGTSAVATALS
jgi:hypothetical protein